MSLIHNNINNINSINSISNDNNICLICFCVKDDSSKSVLFVDNFVYKKCNCLYVIHNDCINAWLNINSKCLICHNKIYKKNCLNYIKFYICNNKFILTIIYIFDKCPKINIFLIILVMIVIVFLKIINILENNNYKNNKFNNMSIEHYFYDDNKFLNI